ncbi:hypothetical protein AYK26_01840 [Euryarchaeota archaeon SM23-78]|nr:MAG: hypothetical protein AYK26_01840 [Euryarchaeota archaeon SM23-78]MBW3000341.1 hypothetical protein [Candidatus Woesearchaeota archaeon]
MNRKAQENPTASTYLVVVGIVIAILVAIALIGPIAEWLKPKDKSLESFNSLADRIEELSKTSGQADAETIFIHLNQDELLLFFDKGANSTIRITDNSGLEKDFVIFKKDVILEEKVRSNAYVLFEKPTSCSEDACMVLCRSFDTYKPFNTPKYLSQKADYLKDNPEPRNVLRCMQVVGIRNFPNIRYFHRKPFALFTNPNSIKELIEASELIAAEMGAGYLHEKDITKVKESYIFYLKGLTLFSITDQFTYEYVDRGAHKKAELSLSVLKGSKPVLVERIDNEYLGYVYLILDNYIYVQPYGKDIVFCYKPPCISSGDEVYLGWMNFVDACLGSQECDGLESHINFYADLMKYTFTTENNELNINYESKLGGDFTLPFDWDVDIYVKKTFDDKKEFSTNSVFIEKVKVSTGERFLKLTADNNDYLFFDIASVKASDTSKARLVFKVNEWEFAE